MQAKVQWAEHVGGACVPGSMYIHRLPAMILPVAGGGVELPAHYPQWRVEYGKMEGVAGLAASLARLREACIDPALSSSASWWGRVEASGWLTHVASLLRCAKFAALCVHRDGKGTLAHEHTHTHTHSPLPLSWVQQQVWWCMAQMVWTVPCR